MFVISQVYYRTKGTRPVTRPQALQETFELCADIVVAKLQSYFSQADEFHNQCLQGLFVYLYVSGEIIWWRLYNFWKIKMGIETCRVGSTQC